MKDTIHNATIAQTMHAIQMTAPGRLERTTRPVPMPAADEILLRTRAVTICSTDVSYYHGNLLPTRYPIVPGHEYVGTVVAIGPEQCPSLLGQRISYFGQTDFDGLAEYRLLRPVFPGEDKSAPFRTDRHFTDDGYAAAIVIPDHVPDEAAPLLEPITAVLRAILRHPPNVGDSVLILGGGPCGAIAGAILQRMFATLRVDVVERSAERRKLAYENYAGRCYGSVAELTDACADTTLYDYVFDALPPISDVAEAEDPRRAALRAIRPEGTYILYGASMVMQKFDTWLMLAKGVNVRSAAFDVDIYPMQLTAQVLRTALGLLETGIVSPDWIVTRAADFEDISTITRTFSHHAGNPDLKTVVRFNG
ncbi:zinc-dependent alcohol dehydrogenase [Jannaschia marina]|uniref:zinc-dependent alcohol dehydrogenase n=1 Tax=Jannaschia marina TaxID=2741674 RepID=UPI0015CB79C0|nr:alcohol dehydrogenase catalytic domain-containing protein [Jannaschia marina]